MRRPASPCNSIRNKKRGRRGEGKLENGKWKVENGKWNIEIDPTGTADMQGCFWIAFAGRAAPLMSPISSFEFPFPLSDVAKISPCALWSLVQALPGPSEG
jgi:hypothetical protein